MPVAAVNGLNIAYEVDGDLGNVPVLLLHGLGRQLIEWDQALVDRK